MKLCIDRGTIGSGGSVSLATAAANAAKYSVGAEILTFTAGSSYKFRPSQRMGRMNQIVLM